MLEEAVHQWIDLANQENGHDNISIVMTHCRVSLDYPVHVPKENTENVAITIEPPESTFTESSQALLDLDLPDSEVENPIPSKSTPNQDKSRKRKWLLPTGLLLLLLIGGSLSIFAWWNIDNQSFQQQCQKLPQTIRKLCPSR